MNQLHRLSSHVCEEERTRHPKEKAAEEGCPLKGPADDICSRAVVPSGKQLPSTLITWVWDIS